MTGYRSGNFWTFVKKTTSMMRQRYVNLKRGGNDAIVADSGYISQERKRALRDKGMRNI